ncbi:aldo/keto reductase [Candidatus Poseidoniaceae archaeon]|jgi:diketogulonate reductase-like aldo/keto reductase|nr:aldo/keto reductase [Candidatus Poseidoniaceae archaeon]
MRISHSTPNGNEEFVHEVPQFGLGVFLMSEEGECKSSVLAALEAGYTHIDTARAYNNEHEVGEAIKESGVDRESLFITTKLRRGHATGYEEVLEHCKKSLELLDTDYIDLYLVHAPPENSEHRAPVWKGMEYCLEQGWVKAIGVSNYGATHLEAMKEYASYMPAVNQVEFNPWLQRPQLFQAIEGIGAKVMAYSPLARGHKVDDPELATIAQRLGCTPAQVAIKFCYDSGCITIPKSSRPERIVENLASLQVDISSEMDAIKAMECNYVSGWDPTSEP